MSEADLSPARLSWRCTLRRHRVLQLWALLVLETAREIAKAHTETGLRAHLTLLVVAGHACQCALCEAIKSSDAARAAEGGGNE